VSWRENIDWTKPYWQDCLPFLDQLGDDRFPSCTRLNSLLPDDLITGGGQQVCFIKSTELTEDAYEQRVYLHGQISTRPDNWHDLFNALIWMQFPYTKIAMNSLHFHALPQQSGGRRGPLRDALTLFDECGVIVFTQRRRILESLTRRNWTEAFLAEGFRDDVKVAVIGHAMLEKFLSPYKAMTAKAVYVIVQDNFIDRSRSEQLATLDSEIASRLLSGSLLSAPDSLAPLPLAGLPGWWSEEKQDKNFYNDRQVFRIPPKDLEPVHPIRL